MRFLAITISLLTASLGLSACGDGKVEAQNGADTTQVQSSHFTIRIDNVAPFTNFKTGLYNTKVGSGTTGALAPNEAFEFSFTAGTRHRLMFASMFGASNDWFFAPGAAGIPLFVNGAPISGDITDQVYLWDAGTEINEEPAVGQHTGPKQSTSPDGPGAIDSNNLVRLVDDPAMLSSGSSFDLPAVASMIRVTVTSNAETRLFTVRIENVSNDSSTLFTSEGFKGVRVSPGVWALGTGGDTIFTAGAVDRGEGLEAIAEMGSPTNLNAALMTHSGVATPLSPGVWVLHRDALALYTNNFADRGKGLENIAERGDISVLKASLEAQLPAGAIASGGFDTAVGAMTPGAIAPGGAYTFEITAQPGDRLTFVQMFGNSNDWFFGPSDSGIELFNDNMPLRGDVSEDIYIWDAGTELSEEPAVGVHGGAPEGAADDLGVVRRVSSDVYATPAATHLRVTLSE